MLAAGFPVCCAAEKRQGIPCRFCLNIEKNAPAGNGGQTPVDNFGKVNRSRSPYVVRGSGPDRPRCDLRKQVIRKGEKNAPGHKARERFSAVASAFVFASAFGFAVFVVSSDGIGGVKAILEQAFEKVKRLSKKRTPVIAHRSSLSHSRTPTRVERRSARTGLAPTS